MVIHPLLIVEQRLDAARARPNPTLAQTDLKGLPGSRRWIRL
jgi:hypothetical protein